MTTTTARRTLSVAEAAEMLGVSTRTGYRMVDAGEIPAIRIGRSLRVPADWVDQVLAGVVRDWEQR